MTDPRDTAAMNGDTWRYNEGLDAILNAQILAKRDHEARNLTYELAYKDMIVAYDKALERCAELGKALDKSWSRIAELEAELKKARGEA